MTKDLTEIQEKLIAIIKAQGDVLKYTADTPTKFEATGTIEAIQGKKKVDGYYFCSVIPKPKDVRFYFFPVYTHKEQLGELPENLQKALKGKSCFHIKKIDQEFEDNLKDLVERAVKVYQEDGLLVK